MSNIDLHIHTDISDGAFSPIEIVNKAKLYSLSAISITDHDSIGAYTSELSKYATKMKIELVPGIEFSTTDHNLNKYHVLGLFIDMK